MEDRFYSGCGSKDTKMYAKYPFENIGFKFKFELKSIKIKAINYRFDFYN